MVLKKIWFLMGLLSCIGTCAALCPLCVVAVSAGVGLARFLGLSDVIIGIWFGGLVCALALWCVALLRRTARFNRVWLLISCFILMYVGMVATLHFVYVGGVRHMCFGCACLGTGIIIGSISFLVGVALHGILKWYHGYKSYFPFQKVVIPVLSVLLTSLVMYAIMRGN